VRIGILLRLSLVAAGLAVALCGISLIRSAGMVSKAYRRILHPLARVPHGDLTQKVRVALDVAVPEDEDWKLLKRSGQRLKLIVGYAPEGGELAAREPAPSIRVRRGTEELPVLTAMGNGYVPIHGEGAVFWVNPGDRVRLEISFPTSRPARDLIVHPYFDSLTVKSEYVLEVFDVPCGVATIVGGGLIGFVAIWWPRFRRPRIVGTAPPTSGRD
jgi:hypothetical protein